MSITPYLYDAYPLAGTLSALTAAACFRLVCAGLLPLGVVHSKRSTSPKACMWLTNRYSVFSSLTSAWSLSLFGFLSMLFIPAPFVLFKWGPALRARSPYANVIYNINP